jgi:hypothetical protein
MLRSLSTVVLVLALAGMATTATAQPADRSSGFEFKSSLHYVPVGIARSFDGSSGEGEKDYAVGWLGISFFPFSVDDGRMFLFGSTYSYAVRIPEDDTTFTMAFTPIAVRFWKQAYLGINLGTMEKTGDDLSHRWTVGAQISLCLAGCR